MTPSDIPTHFATTITATIARINDYRERRVRLTESDTIRVLVLPVLQALGWDLQDVEEVRSEYRHASADNPVDYALFLHGSPVLFVEAKALGVSLLSFKYSCLLSPFNQRNGIPIRRAWRADEKLMIRDIAFHTCRPEAGQGLVNGGCPWRARDCPSHEKSGCARSLSGANHRSQGAWSNPLSALSGPRQRRSQDQQAPEPPHTKTA